MNKKANKMPAIDDLDAPLGQGPKNNNRIFPALISGVFFTIILVIGGTYYLGNDQPKTSKPLQPEIVASDTSSAKLKPSSDSSGNGSGKTISEPGELVELQPTGKLTAPSTIPIQRPKRDLSEIRQKQILAHLPDSELSEKGATGIIPKRSPDGLRAMDVYSRQPETEGNFGVARVVLIVAGMGISQTGTQFAIKQLPGSVTFAFATSGNSLSRWMQLSRRAGHELLLQVPMEPFGYPQNNPGTHTLRTGVSTEENFANLHWAMSRMTNYVGVMNYLGGKMISNNDALLPVFNEIAERGLLFVEDGSIKNSVGEQTAKQSLLPYTKAHVLIDRINSRKEIAKQLNLLAAQAKRTGLAIGIANAFPNSIKMISQFVKKAKEQKLEITPVSAVISDPAGKP